MRAHYKRSKHQMALDWFRLWLSPIFERATCGNAPEGLDSTTWSRMWTGPETPADTRMAVDLCNTLCPALEECRVLVDLGQRPRGVVQAGHAYGLRVGAKPKGVASATTPTMKDKAAC